jgi:hypothetical protein
MDEFLQTTLQTLLDTYALTNTTALEKVSVVIDNSLDPMFSSPSETKVITCVYRELPGTLPNNPLKDRIANGTLYVTAIDSEKAAVRAIFQAFIDANHAVEQTDGTILYLNSLVAIGAPVGNGYDEFQTWTMNIIYRVVDKLSSIHECSVTFGSNIMNVANGLITYNVQRIPVYAEYPVNGNDVKKIFRFMKFRLTFSFLDNSGTVAANLKAIIYDTATIGYSLSAKSGSSTLAMASFSAKLVMANESVSEQGFPIITLTFEKG